MAAYALGFPLQLGSAGLGSIFQVGPIFEIQTGPTDSARVNEIVLRPFPNASAASQMSVGFGLPAAKGVGTLGYALTVENTFNTNTAPGVLIYTQWTTMPTVPTNFLRRVSNGSAVGAATGSQPLFCRFPRGLILAKSTSLVAWMISTALTVAAGGVQYDGHVDIDI
jgi:hypothetical protein